MPAGRRFIFFIVLHVGSRSVSRGHSQTRAMGPPVVMPSFPCLACLWALFFLPFFVAALCLYSCLNRFKPSPAACGGHTAEWKQASRANARRSLLETKLWASSGQFILFVHLVVCQCCLFICW